MKSKDKKDETNWVVGFFATTSLLLLWLLTWVCQWTSAQLGSDILLKEPKDLKEKVALEAISLISVMSDFYFSEIISILFVVVIIIWVFERRAFSRDAARS